VTLPGDRSASPNGSRLARIVSLLCLTFLLSGCAAGSPSVVAPVAPEKSTVTVAQAQAPAPVATVPVPTLAAVPQATVAAVTAKIDPPADNVAAFAQTVPAMTAPLPTAETVVGGVAAVPAAQAERLPPPPDPGTGLSEIIEGGSNDQREVALTFDAGADTGYAADILDLLRDEGIQATFGMTGQWASENPELVQRIAAEGHQLINHTWDHASLTGANTGLPPMTPEQVTQELADTENLVRDLTGGYEMRPYFRPPYGDYDEASLGYLYDNGYYLTIWWTCDSHGWAGWGSQEIIDYCTTNIKPHEILLLHVGAVAAGDFEALPGLIKFFRDNGYAFVTIEQMLQP
jgi:peptidoglycan-N-acetylglucosamine deacetylase